MSICRKILIIMLFSFITSCYYNDSNTPSSDIPSGSDQSVLPNRSYSSSEYPFLAGAGIYDITGPAAELGMMGYSMTDQKTAGINTRLRARAFIIASAASGKRVVIMSADLGMIFQAVKQQVVEKLKLTYGNLYTEKNVLLTGNHTHSGPGGYSHYTLYNLSIFGFDAQNFNCIVDGIYKSIVMAHNNLAPAAIYAARGELDNCGWNRSPDAYANNPAAEKALYSANTDKTMTLLRFTGADGSEIGTINWFAVHPVSIGNTNRLISSDHKGMAEYLFEKKKGTNYTSSKTFIAAFAQSNAGDVSPNIYWGYPDGIHDYERMNILAERQYNKAVELYNSADDKLSSELDFRHMYVDFSSQVVSPGYMAGMDTAGNGYTAEACLGVSLVAGSTEDGVGIGFVQEGMTYDGVTWPAFTMVPGLQEQHKEKIILLPTGTMTPYPWTPEILPVQIIRIGNIVIAGVPFECTTMSGRRIRQTILGQLQSSGVEHVIIAGLSNAYSGYVATREEYATQQYEGASTLFGPYTLNAYQEQFARLAASMKTGASVEDGPTPPDLRNAQNTLITGVVFDDKPLFKSFGSVLTDANSSYNTGETVSVVFQGAHPKNNLKTQSTFLAVEKKSGSSWITAAVDSDPETIYQWERDGIANSKVTIKWTIPSDAGGSYYRIRHFGDWKSGWTGTITSYTGTSGTFKVN